MDDNELEEIPFIDHTSRSTNANIFVTKSSPERPHKMESDSSKQQTRSKLFQDAVLHPSNALSLIESCNYNSLGASNDEIDVPVTCITVPNIGASINLKTNGVDQVTGSDESVVIQRRNSFKFPIHAAAEKGKVKELERRLAKGDPLHIDFKKRTPLHYACGFAYQKKALKMVDIILKSPQAQNTVIDNTRKKRLVDYQDENQETALHIAARTGHPEVVEKLLFSAADVNLKDRNKLEPLQLIYSKTPTAMIPVFNSAVECKVGDTQDQNLLLNFDFGSIVGYPEPNENTSSFLFELETKLLAYCLQQSEQKRAAILLHPVVQTFLHFKWKKIRYLLWLSILYHVIWLLLYTIFTVDLYLIQCPLQMNNVEASQSNSLLNSEHNSSTATTSHVNDSGGIDMISEEHNHNGSICDVGHHFPVLNTELIVLFFVSISVGIKELYEMYSSPELKYYFLQMENVGQWLLIGAVFISAIPVFSNATNSEIEIYAWQYQASAFGIFLAWSLILSQIGKIPRFQIYIEILVKVLKSFVMFMITFASLLIAFMVSFQILMPEQTEFSNFPWSFVKVLTMMTGELNYDDVFYGEDSDSQIPFPTATKLLFAAFVAIVTIILFNLLIGLTVSDIQGLQSVAQLSSLSSQLEQIYLMEKFVLSKKFQRWLSRFGKNHWLRYFLVTQQHSNAETNMGIDIHITRIPRDLQHKVRDIAAPNTGQEDDEDDEEEIPLSSGSSDSGKASKSNISNKEDLKAQIKEILKEILDELKQQSLNEASKDTV
ncbi:Transient receptor potential channel pyrexia [Orchesella cincta]|uniref:Transient receptor potential channel pyrexia n=1 Tax=Orchesella cincta TaxID=48709 RepID=A0A1D2MJK4_ORCCI|nr:Transient receptor potential channel pyrexia [Orchesella cincta]